jgi:hypothetical protein
VAFEPSDNSANTCKLFQMGVKTATNAALAVSASVYQSDLPRAGYISEGRDRRIVHNGPCAALAVFEFGTHQRKIADELNHWATRGGAR